MRRLVRTHAVVLLIGVLGCRGDEIVPGVSDSAFVSTMAELQRLQEDTTLDSARLAAARQATLQRRGLTATAVEQAARALAGDPERAGKLWEAIQRQVRGDSVPPPSAGGPPVLGPHRSP